MTKNFHLVNGKSASSTGLIMTTTNGKTTVMPSHSMTRTLMELLTKLNSSNSLSASAVSAHTMKLNSCSRNSTLMEMVHST